ncbi:hypothetical protein F4778DRAFT_783326 [Xylariomycetidae sp. FL2044]|nr:hypothetical protein F4778DRAFT_783326 [Xylariomycetidae sp. FL2044]
MFDGVDQLVLAPFKEIVEKGNTAVENARAAGQDAPAPMLKASQGLIKEGERALKRLEPLCTRNYDEYGHNFIDAVKEHDEIAQHRSELSGLLWDFEDFIEVETFDSDRFDEVQKSSRRAAPIIMEILNRMRLEPATSSPGQSSRAPSSRPDSTSFSIHHDQVPTSIIVDPPPSGGTKKPMEEAELQADKMRGTMAGPDQGLEGNPEPPPPPPSENPWQLSTPPPSRSEGQTGAGGTWERLPSTKPDSPTIPPTRAAGPQGVASPARSWGGDDDPYWPQSGHDHEGRLRAASQSDGSRSPGRSHRWTNSTQGSTDSTRSPTQAYMTHTAMPRSRGSPSYGQESSAWSAQMHETSPQPSEASLAVPSAIPEDRAVESYIGGERHHSTESVNSSIYALAESLSPMSTTSQGHGHSLPFASIPPIPPSDPMPAVSFSPSSFQYPPRSRSSSTATANYSSSTLTTRLGLESVHQPVGMRSSEGLIPVDAESPVNDMIPLREPELSIGPDSSFWKMKGFCKGAEEAQRGQPGFKKIKRPVGGFSMALVAKCNHCLYELDHRSVEQDLNNSSAASYTASGISFRLRVLQKSHLYVRHVEEQLYGCLFCVQQGKTIEESDSTVFFNQKQLFTHMARHPHPLPQIPGVTVIEGPEIPTHLKDDFDLHFPLPPSRSIMTGLAREIARLPAGVAAETRKNTNGSMRTPPDRTDVLQFAVGARIVGIEYPAKYEGKWGIGWHDGVRAAFEADAVTLDPPARGEVKMQGTSQVQATARWKWNQKGDEKWLRFDKGDVIKNIGWSHTDHWCWSGTTSKGRGVFPQSHLDPGSFHTVQQPGDAAVSVASWEKSINNNNSNSNNNSNNNNNNNNRSIGSRFNIRGIKGGSSSSNSSSNGNGHHTGGGESRRFNSFASSSSIDGSQLSPTNTNTSRSHGLWS